jgi:hypothetical protein
LEYLKVSGQLIFHHPDTAGNFLCVPYREDIESNQTKACHTNLDKVFVTHGTLSISLDASLDNYDFDTQSIVCRCFFYCAG